MLGIYQLAKVCLIFREFRIRTSSACSFHISIPPWTDPCIVYPKIFFSEGCPGHSDKAKSPTGVESRIQEKEKMLPGSTWASAWLYNRFLGILSGTAGSCALHLGIALSTAKGRVEDRVSASGTHRACTPSPTSPKTKQEICSSKLQTRNSGDVSMFWQAARWLIDSR